MVKVGRTGFEDPDKQQALRHPRAGSCSHRVRDPDDKPPPRMGNASCCKRHCNTRGPTCSCSHLPGAGFTAASTIKRGTQKHSVKQSYRIATLSALLLLHTFYVAIYIRHLYYSPNLSVFLLQVYQASPRLILISAFHLATKPILYGHKLDELYRFHVGTRQFLLLCH